MTSTNGRIHYKRSRFSSHIPESQLFTSGHCWLEQEGEDTWRVGYTKFAMRMLGEIVEHEFEVKPGDTIEKGQVIGWIEGFKAVTDIYSPISGQFECGNPALEQNINLMTRDPHGKGWLFKLRGQPDEECLDVHSYIEILDGTIDKMVGK